MATYRYWAVRRDIYQHSSNVKLMQNRSFLEMKQLFTKKYWGMLVGMILCLVAFLGSFWLPSPYQFLAAIFFVGILVISGISEYLGDKLYQPAARQNEIKEQADSLDSYLIAAKQILLSHGVVNKEQRDSLRQECCERLSKYRTGSTKFMGRFADIFVGIILGIILSVVASITDKPDTALLATASLLTVGLAIWGIVRMIKKLMYFSEGGFKDQILLNVLDELNYIV